jgi:pSer/pThr/pTyr-binding forkhead associated (FHA) protein
MKCLSKAPADRYPSAHALVAELRRFRAIPGRKQHSLSLRDSLPSVILVARDTGKQTRLFKAVNLIGRSSECDIVLRSREVSKHHCRILLEANEVVVEDLDSVNGTLVNGSPAKRVALHTGDQLEIAGYLFEVRQQPGRT